MTDLPALRLKHHEDRRIAAGHLWVFSNEVDTVATPLSAFGPGNPCRIVSHRDRFLGYGYVNPKTLICARVLSRDPNHPPGRNLLVQRLRVALALRERLYAQPFYRWVYGESDGLPGLVLDRYGDVIVGQIGTAGMEAMRDEIAAAVREVLDPSAMLWKNDSGARELEGLPDQVEAAFGEVPATVTLDEQGLSFSVPLFDGQKTGWFYDQSANRHSLAKYVQGMRVLDVFSYLGAWGLGAARSGASEVTCVDSSAPALELLAANARANGLEGERRERRCFQSAGADGGRRPEVRRGRHRPAGVHQAPEGHPEGRSGVPPAQPARHAAPRSRRHPRVLLAARIT